MKILTWAEQQEREKQSRREWLENASKLNITAVELANRLGIERGQLYKMAQKFGIELPSRDNIKAKKADVEKRRLEAKKAEQKRQAMIDRTRDTAARELQRRKSQLMAEGFTEQQALRALAHQLGVTQEAAQ
jgi:hypothetical protein